jgi:dihydrofolate reductase
MWAVIAGRRTYPASGACGGTGPMPGLALFVITHPAPGTVPAGEPPYTFITEGIEAAIEPARSAAAGKDVVLIGAGIVQQCLRAGLPDELVINPVPVVLGRDVRLLDDLNAASIELDLVSVLDAPGVTQLTSRVPRQNTAKTHPRYQTHSRGHQPNSACRAPQPSCSEGACQHPGQSHLLRRNSR